MTTPGRGGGNEINLAALWVPVMPETSHMGEEMRKAGAESKRQFEQGFNSGQSPEAMGQSFGSRFSSSMQHSLSHFEMPFGLTNWAEKMGGEIDTKLISKLRGEATDALSRYRTEYENLTAAQNRAAEAERRIAVAREGGFNKASIMLPLMSEQSRAATALETSHKGASAALEEYNTKNSKLSGVLAESTGASSTFAGMMGGAVVAAAQLAVGGIEKVTEAVIEGAVEAFKLGVEGAHEFAEKMLELGESYEHIGIQITEFSTASGEKFEELESHAQKVFGTLDVEGKNVGQTMAQLASQLDAEPGPALDRLTAHVEELQGRFTGLKANDLASIFVAFGTPVEEADKGLASLLQSARGAGQSIGDLTASMSGEAAITLKQAGLNLEQSGAFMAELLRLGPSGRSVMMGLNAAMKDFGEEGLSFSEGMKMASEKLRELGDTAAGQELSEKLFGTRRWSVAMAAAQDYLNVVEQGPDAFNASSESIDQFTERTRTLQNEWEIVKHKVEEAFLPMGLQSVELASTGLDELVGFVEEHMDDIKRAVMVGGVEIIKAARNIQIFGQGLLMFFAPVADAIETTMAAAIGSLGAFSHGAGEIISNIPGMKDIGNGLIDAGKAGEAMGEAMDRINVGDKMRELAQWSKQHPIDVEKASESWLRFADNVATSMDSADSSVSKSNSWFGASGSGFPGVGAPGGGGGVGGSAGGGPGGGPTVGGAGNTVGAPVIGGPLFGAAGSPGTASGNDPESVKRLARQLFPWGEDQWQAFVALEEHEAGWDPTAKNPSSGAFGVGQFLGHESDQYAPGYSTDPAMQLQTMFQYIADRYGNPAAAWAQYYQHPDGAGWYQTGGDVLPGGKGADMPTGKGTDTVPAWLTPGEYVWDKETVDKWGWLIEGLHHAKGFQGGGAVDSGLDTKGAQADTIAVAEAAKALFGISDIGMLRSPDGYNEHASGEAADVMVGNDKSMGDQVAQYFLQNAAQFGVQYVLWQQKQWNPNGTTTPMGDRGSATANHMDHVHVRTLGGGFPVGADTSGYAAPSSGETSNTPSPVAAGAFGTAGTTPAGKNGANYPGIAGQYGGFGAYGGETYDQQVQAQQNIQEAQDRAADLDHQISQNEKKIQDLKDQIAKVGVSDKTGLLTGQPLPRSADEQRQDDEKRKRLNDQLDEATYQLTVSQRERGQQDGKITEAQRKAQESMYKKPAGSGTTQKPTGAAAFSQLGSSLLGGIGEELGFGDLFAKPPWEWGAVKLLTGAASWALGTANAWADEIGKGHTGVTGFAPIAGWDDKGGPSGGGILGGLAGGLGIDLPKASVSTGPNVVPGMVPPVSSGQGLGPAPGPVIAGDYMPIHVQAGVNPGQILGPVQEQRNAQNANSFTHSGGFPAP